MKKAILPSLAFLAFSPFIWAQNNNDLFNYGMKYREENGSDSWGQPDWDEVSCRNIERCTGYPNNYPYGFGFTIEGENMCQWCPADESRDCGLHRQSPIDLKRDRSIPNSEFEKDCPDWHFMITRNDACSFEDLRNSFSIQRHALQLDIPQLKNGQIACEENGLRIYPQLDYSKGFPDWWWMQRVDITVPSQHTQEGNQYAAEVTLAHFYEVDHPKNQLGHVGIFLQDYPDAESWAFLDKLICMWRIEEDKVREECGLEPVAPYGRCQLFRDQEPTEEWLKEEAGEPLNENTEPTVSSTKQPTVSLTAPPTLAPIASSPAPTVEQSVAQTLVRDTTTKEPTVAPVVGKPIVSEVLSASPSRSPLSQPAKETVDDSIPPGIDCSSIGFSISRFCDSDLPCCESVRSDADFCWEAYDILGGGVQSACYHCCSEQRRVGPARDEKPGLPKTVQCSEISSIHRTCKEDSCCSNPRSESSFCSEQYALYPSLMEEICYYCCSTPKEVGPSTSRRNLKTPPDSNQIPERSKVIYSHGKKFVLGPENFEDETAEHEYFKKYQDQQKRRSMQTGPHLENYEDIEWHPYEWLMKVGTEYYFRYEGTMLVPPCWETVHWRVMKDPIVVHKRQIDELHRLLAWRRDPNTCQSDTAGILSDDGNRVKVSRDVQYYHTQHRMVFCECKDWPSKFEGDKEWCNDWKKDLDHDRFYTRPYSFDSNGKWLP